MQLILFSTAFLLLPRTVVKLFVSLLICVHNRCSIICDYRLSDCEWAMLWTAYLSSEFGAHRSASRHIQ